MKAELKKKWVDALRSGQYVQGQMRLTKMVTTADNREERRFCCLGVLCEVMGLKLAPSGEAYALPENIGKPLTFQLDEKRLNECGIDGKVQDALIGKNDTDNETFEQIADYIERCLPCDA